MTQHEAQLNGFLVNVFNDILRLEEASIRKGPCKNLSVSEMHVLEAVEKSSVDASGTAGMAEVACYVTQNLHLQKPMVQAIGTVIGTHAGPGACGIAFFANEPFPGETE